MNKVLETALTDLITKSVQGIDAAGKFLLTEIPEVIQQLLMWHGVYNFILFLVGMIFLTTFCIIDFKFFKVCRKEAEKNEDGGAYRVFALVNMFGGFFSSIFLSELLNLQWLKIWIAPKVWLLEYAAALAK